MFSICQAELPPGEKREDFLFFLRPSTRNIMRRIVEGLENTIEKNIHIHLRDDIESEAVEVTLF